MEDTGTQLRELRGELRADVADIRGELRTITARLEDRYARADQLAELRRQVDRIDAWLTWAQRVALGGVLVAVLTVAGVASPGG